MARAHAWLSVFILSFGIAGCAELASAQTSASAAQPAKRVCSVDSQSPTLAETALNKKDYPAAEKQFRDVLAHSPHSDQMHEGLIRDLLAQDKVADAAKEAETWIAAEPDNAWALVAIADVRLRQGDPREALTQFINAMRTDPCNARVYFGVAEVDSLVGRHATVKRMIEQAYALHPTDDDIHTWWISTRPRAQRLAMWADYAEHSDQINDDDKTKLKTRLEKDSLYHASDCRMAPNSPTTATIPMVKLMDGPNHFTGWGLDVKFNGKTRRLQIDSGASGITISRAAAMFLGIKREDATEVGGIGDKAKVKTSIAHVASIRIGGVEFTNCPVEIIEKFSVLDSDGLIGSDVFDDSLVTLDFPKHELRIAPLPLRPGETKDAATSGDDPEPHDPYVAPEMKNWMRIYRSGHDLLIPTDIVETKHAKDDAAWKDKLFMLDTGSESNLISPAAAREVTKVSRDDSMGIRGLQGEVNKVYAADRFTVAFAGLRLDAPSMTAIDLTNISHDDGVEVSGLIGAPALFQLTMHIDYRDNLLLFEYKPPK